MNSIFEPFLYIVPDIVLECKVEVEIFDLKNGKIKKISQISTNFQAQRIESYS